MYRWCMGCSSIIWRSFDFRPLRTAAPLVFCSNLECVTTSKSKNARMSVKSRFQVRTLSKSDTLAYGTELGWTSCAKKHQAQHTDPVLKSKHILKRFEKHDSSNVPQLKYVKMKKNDRLISSSVTPLPSTESKLPWKRRWPRRSDGSRCCEGNSPHTERWVETRRLLPWEPALKKRIVIPKTNQKKWRYFVDLRWSKKNVYKRWVKLQFKLRIGRTCGLKPGSSFGFASKWFTGHLQHGWKVTRFFLVSVNPQHEWWWRFMRSVMTMIDVELMNVPKSQWLTNWTLSVLLSVSISTMFPKYGSFTTMINDCERRRDFQQSVWNLYDAAICSLIYPNTPHSWPCLLQVLFFRVDLGYCNQLIHPLESHSPIPALQNL